MFYKRFRLVKPLKVKEGTLLTGAEITIMNDKIFYNGGVVEPAYYNLLADLVEYEMNEGFNYLREIPIPYNKA